MTRITFKRFDEPGWGVQVTFNGVDLLNSKAECPPVSVLDFLFGYLVFQTPLFAVAFCLATLAKGCS